MRRAGEIVTGKFVYSLVASAGLPPKDVQDLRLTVLDNACGSGVVTAVMLEKMTAEQRNRARVTCGDVQQTLIDYVRARGEKEDWEGVETLLVDAQDTKLPSSHYTHVLTSFALMLVPKPLSALQEIHRLLLPGGVNGFTTWNHVGWIPLVQRAFTAIPGIPPFPSEDKYKDFMGTGRWDLPAFIKQQVEAQGFVDVKIDRVSADSDIPSPEEFVKRFGHMFVGLTTRWFTEEQKKADWPEKIKETLLKQLQEEYGVGKPWKMPMTANVVTCRKPAS
ncbi:S-adenosyl-L-methionine-dependent methyltransferase [Calocera cornea HHB12733]|uniref:S-adenosyl-L-methionine-dependent methyltransferase n=1 Tax=Calocera cornea HHB12733 TaxID=1353952 RepID=A0A165IIY7_9BASI|nr:S-adenosyl-L-methionine-dependent methyltransferase [Calocera cornea HHB12733]